MADDYTPQRKGKPPRCGRGDRAIGRRYAVVEIRYHPHPVSDVNPSGRTREARAIVDRLNRIDGVVRLSGPAVENNKAFVRKNGRKRLRNVSATVEVYSVPLKAFVSLSTLRSELESLGAAVYYGRGPDHNHGSVRPIAVGSGSELQAKHRAGAIRRKVYTELERSGELLRVDFLSFVYGAGGRGPNGETLDHWLTKAPAQDAVVSSLDEMAIETTGMSISPNWQENAEYWLGKLKTWNGLIPSHLRHAEKRVDECCEVDDWDGMAYWQGVVRRIGSVEASKHFDDEKREHTKAHSSDPETGLPNGGFVGRELRKAGSKYPDGRPMKLATSPFVPVDVPDEPWERKGLAVIEATGIPPEAWYPGKQLPFRPCECGTGVNNPSGWIGK